MPEWDALPQRPMRRRPRAAARAAAGTTGGGDEGRENQAPPPPGATAGDVSRGTGDVIALETGPGEAAAGAAQTTRAETAPRQPTEANLRAVRAAVAARTGMARCEEGHSPGKGSAADGEYFEYLDHTADVQLHSWGETLEAALEHMVLCMFNYMTDIATVQVDERLTRVVEVKGHDLKSLLFAFLDEFLFLFHAEGLTVKKATVLSLDRGLGGRRGKEEEEEEGEGKLVLRARGEGEAFDLAKHPQGTEVKAITYSNMQIHEEEGRTDLYVIVDI